MQDFWPRMHVAPSDFVALTRGGTLCDDKDRLGAAEFELAMREQIRLYTQAVNDVLQSPCVLLAHLQLTPLSLFTLPKHQQASIDSAFAQTACHG